MFQWMVAMKIFALLLGFHPVSSSGWRAEWMQAALTNVQVAGRGEGGGKCGDSVRGR